MIVDEAPRRDGSIKFGNGHSTCVRLLFLLPSVLQRIVLHGQRVSLTPRVDLYRFVQAGVAVESYTGNPTSTHLSL